MKSYHLGTRIDPKSKAKLKKLAKKAGVSMSEMNRRIIAKYIGRTK